MIKIHSVSACHKLTKSYEVDQCALYKLASKKRLAKVLFPPPRTLIALGQKNNNYRSFTLPETTCIFTGKFKKRRNVQEPKSKLRAVHQRILELLKRVAPPSYAHAAVEGRSYRSNASAHVEGEQISTYDVRKFYPSTSRRVVFRFWFDIMCCAPDVAGILTDLTCYEGGLPTGSPLSPLLSLWANRAMFDEMHRLAVQHKLVFTCYVDDLTFSGKNLPNGLGGQVSRVAARYGHSLASEKTRIFYKRHDQKHVTGIVIRDGQLMVPHSRFHKARKISEHMKRSAISAKEKIALAEKLVGLLSEAAFLDPRHIRIAKKSRIDLKRLREEYIVPITTSPKQILNAGPDDGLPPF